MTTCSENGIDFFASSFFTTLLVQKVFPTFTDFHLPTSSFCTAVDRMQTFGDADWLILRGKGKLS